MNQQHAQQEAGADLQSDDDAELPVDVDIEGGKVTEVEAPAPAPKKPAEGEQPAARVLPRPQARIQALVSERDQLSSVADRLTQELAQARADAAASKAAQEVAERSGMENLVARTKAEVVAAKAALIAAKENNDPVAEVEAQARLGRAVAEESDADAWVSANPKPESRQPTEQPRQQQQQQRQPEFQPLSAPVRDFIADNEWFHPLKMGDDGRPLVDRHTGRPISNPSYDEELHDAAMLEDKKIQREIRLGRLPKDFLETPEYFERIATNVQKNFPDAFEGEEEEAPPPARGKAPQMGGAKQPVSPSNRQVPGQQQQKQGSKMRLDGEQAALVRSLVDNGTLVYPRNHPDAGKRGQKMSYDDAYVKYAKEVQTDQANQK